jgi:hypothetical protein
MAGGKKRVETIPADWLDVIRPRVEAGRRFKEVAAELLSDQCRAIGARPKPAFPNLSPPGFTTP